MPILLTIQKKQQVKEIFLLTLNPLFKSDKQTVKPSFYRCGAFLLHNRAPGNTAPTP